MKDIIKEKLFTKKTSKELPYTRWWIAEDDEAYRHMIQLADSIDENQKERKYQDLRHGYLYQNKQTRSLLPGDLNRSLPERFHVTYNVVKACIDTLTSRIAQNKPRPRVLTEKGDYSQQQRGKKLTKYLDGVLEDSMTYRQGTQAFKDGGIFGTGVIKVIADHARGKIRTERVLITEITVDDLEGSYGAPQSLYQERLVAKDTLIAQFPDHAEAINGTKSESSSARTTTTEMIKVYEGWHLPNAEGKEGRHILAIKGCKFVDEEWVHDCFPFAFFRYNTNISSFYGQGISEELLGTQLEINKILRDIQRAQNLIAVPRVLLEYNAQVVAAHLNNGIGSAIKYKGTKPDFFTPTAMNNEIYSHVKWLIETGYEKVGLSQLSATSKKPSGLDSGRALREFSSIESERFATTSQAYRDFFEDIAKLTIKFSKELYSHNKDLAVTTESKKFIESIKWKDVDLDDDKFITKIYSSSMFPTEPAAKLQKVEEYVRAGWMDRDAAIRLLDFPDVESWETLETADRDYVEKILEDILKEGKFTPPEPEMLLKKDINIARKAYINAKANGASDDRLELLLRWIEAASSLLPAVQPEIAAPIEPELAEPLASPQALPQTGLLPQV